MADILNEILDGLNELIKETDEKYDKFLFEGTNDDLLKTFFSLIKYNGGQFKSDKQKDYLRRNGDNYHLTKTMYFGDNQGAKAETAYDVYLDDIGVVKIIKWSKNKTKQTIFWERTPETIQRSKNFKILSDFTKATQSERNIEKAEYEQDLEAIVAELRKIAPDYSIQSLKNYLATFLVQREKLGWREYDINKFKAEHDQVKQTQSDASILNAYQKMEDLMKKYPQGFDAISPKYYDSMGNLLPQWKSPDDQKAYLDSLQSQQPIQEDGNQPRILRVIDAFEKAGKEADEFAFSGERNSGSWNGTFGNAMSPNAGVQYQEYMKNQPKIEDRNAKAKELQDKAQVLADEIKKEYAWNLKSNRGKGMPKYASLYSMINYFKQKYSQEQQPIQEQPLNEKTYKVYHGTNQQFSKFDFKRATQGIVWFTDSPESIQKGEHGGAGNKIIMTRYITINKPAGWEEYEKYGLQQLEDMGYDGVILPQGNKTDYFVFSNKNISAKGPKELNEDVSPYYEKTYPEVFAELNALDDKALQPKEQEFYDEYKRVSRWLDDPAKEKELLDKMNMVRDILENRKKIKYDNTLKRFIGQPFLGSTIEDIQFPDLSQDGEFETFSIYLADEAEFSYDAGQFPQFKYFKYLGEDQESIYKVQKLDRPTPPEDAILTQKELDLLNLIIRLNNTTYSKKPYPRNASVKGGKDTVNLPTIQTADLQWMVGQGGTKEKISKVEVKNDGSKYYSGGFLYAYFEVDDLQFNSPWTTKHYNYVMHYDAFGKPTKEELQERSGMGEYEKTTYMRADVYDAIHKGILQINPKSKVFNKITPLTY